VASLKDYTTICSSAPSEILAIAALRRRDELAERCRAIVRRNLSLAREFFSGRKDCFEWFEPGGGSTVFPKLLGTQSVRDFCERTVEEKSLMVLPDSVFDVDWNHFRVGLGRESFPEALEVLRKFIG
jgi:Aspartate/tyrosine/aromatic aminotransferase